MAIHLTLRTLTYAVAGLVLGIILITGNTHAETRHFRHVGADGTVTFSDAPIVNGSPVRRSYRRLVRQPVAANPCKGLSAQQLSNRGEALDAAFIAAGRQFSLSPALLKAVARAESCFDANAVSHAGAQGLMQLMPATARMLGVSNSFNSQQNLLGGARYLADMLKRYSANLDLALAAYNAGPGSVDKYQGVPPYPETQRYIVSVKRFRERFRQSMP